jgi:hypothetical protein
MPLASLAVRVDLAAVGRGDENRRRRGVEAAAGSEVTREIRRIHVQHVRHVAARQAGKGGGVGEVAGIGDLHRVAEAVAVRVLAVEGEDGLLGGAVVPAVQRHLHRQPVGIAGAAAVEVEVADTAVAGVAGQIVQTRALGRGIDAEEGAAIGIAGLRRDRQKQQQQGG